MADLLSWVLSWVPGLGPDPFSASAMRTALRATSVRAELLQRQTDNRVAALEADVADLFRKGKCRHARLRVEAILAELETLHVLEIVHPLAELCLARLHLLEVPAVEDEPLLTAVRSLVFAAPRVSQLKELVAVADQASRRFEPEVLAVPASGEGVHARLYALLTRSASTPPVAAVDARVARIAKIHSLPDDVIGSSESGAGPSAGRERRIQPLLDVIAGRIARLEGGGVQESSSAQVLELQLQQEALSRALSHPQPGPCSCGAANDACFVPCGHGGVCKACLPARATGPDSSCGECGSPIMYMIGLE
ncbi:uncharacterized protein AMSG_02042 [Thecamonas trahens ATCC 50062]|uniref:Uncharacterized protein n=1 Tax=Thecamonas trahens ATCC 50062 TaxID=461836 RepID=A0A0L0DUX5_THETB|nr:hypothetical protein AMSG_02042 [Thecamonas trahens ATCC 50062]KNC56030.1 hypothetical protein AMSG_02042 [Thecamonas trahens ATCC 50062]|eukprot:XP_013761074.1 hypothetical protein AMSG_02042 [Thecamonas trahens ATCC 50062]